MQKFWDFKQADDKHEAELYFYGEISDTSWDGDEVTPQAFKKDLDRLGDLSNLDIYINSLGGDVFAGLSIYNMLKRQSAHTRVHVDGIAASAASVIAMAGDEIIMPRNAMMMIHNAWTLTGGNADKLKATAEKLDRIDGTLAQIYSDRTGLSTETVRDMMARETWMNGDEALGKKFCDRTEENKRFAALADDMSAVAKSKYENASEIDFSAFSTEKVSNDDTESKSEPEKPADEPFNGGNSEPVEDKATEEQELRQRRLDLKQKLILMEGM